MESAIKKKIEDNEKATKKSEFLKSRSSKVFEYIHSLLSYFVNKSLFPCPDFEVCGTAGTY